MAYWSLKRLVSNAVRGENVASLGPGGRRRIQLEVMRGMLTHDIPIPSARSFERTMQEAGLGIGHVAFRTLYREQTTAPKLLQAQREGDLTRQIPVSEMPTLGRDFGAAFTYTFEVTAYSAYAGTETTQPMRMIYSRNVTPERAEQIYREKWEATPAAANIQITGVTFRGVAKRAGIGE